MDPIFGGILGLAGGFINNLFAGDRQEEQQAFNAQQQAMANQFNAQQAAINREFQANQIWSQQNFAREEVAKQRQFNSAEAADAYYRNLSADNTKYQRTMNDMRAAGLNPIIAGGGGSVSGVSGPAATSSAASSSAAGGSQATGGAASASAAPVFDIASHAISTALQLRRQNAEIENINADTQTKLREPDLREAQTGNLRVDTGKKHSEIDILVENLQGAKTEAERERIRLEFLKTDLGRFLTQLGEGKAGASTAKDAVDAASKAIDIPFDALWKKRIGR